MYYPAAVFKLKKQAAFFLNREVEMEQEKKKDFLKRKKKHKDRVFLPLEREAVSTLDRVEQLIEGTLKPEGLNRQNLIDCTEALKQRGYTNIEISRLLKMSRRTVQRYLEKIRENNSLVPSDEFQETFVGEMLGNFREQYQRLVRMSYQRDISASKQMRAIGAACQVMKMQFDTLRDLGYLRAPIRHSSSSGDVSVLSPFGNNELLERGDSSDPGEWLKSKVEKLVSSPGFQERKALEEAKRKMYGDESPCEDEKDEREE